MNNFAELSGCVFSWIEEQCKPGELQELMGAILRQVKTNRIGHIRIRFIFAGSGAVVVGVTGSGCGPKNGIFKNSL
jgi:hypothetical protein